MAFLPIFGERYRAILRHSFFGNLPTGMTWTRSSNAWYFDHTGTIQQSSANGARFDYNPLTLAPRGLMLEGSRSNYVRNSVLAGAVVGSPGTFPTNMARNVGSGITIDVAAVGTEFGMSYIDLRVYGTASGSSGVSLQFETNTGIAAANGQYRNISCYVKKVSGSTANIDIIRLNALEKNSGGTTLVTNYGPNIFSSVTSAIYRAEYTFQCTGGATVAYEKPLLEFAFTNGAVIDLTIRVYQPQEELVNNASDCASSPILTSGAAYNRVAEYGAVTGLSWINQTNGALVITALSPNGTTSLSSTQPIVTLDDGTAANRHLVGRYTNKVAGITTVSSSTTGNPTLPATWDANTVLKQAYSFALNDFRAAGGGTLSTADTSGAMPTGITRLLLGNSSFNGWLKEICYYSKKLPDFKLQSLTR